MEYGTASAGLIRSSCCQTSTRVVTGPPVAAPEERAARDGDGVSNGHDGGGKAFDVAPKDDVDVLDFAGFQRECGTIRAIRTYTTSPYQREYR